jgi:hypothetical protein
MLVFQPGGCRLLDEMDQPRDERVKQVAIGVSILVVLTVTVPALLLGWHQLPGLVGEWLGTIIGIMTTPFFMETTFVILGLVIVISLNTWRQRKDGDEFVYLEQVSGPDVPEHLPDHAKWAIYREKPLDRAIPSLLEQAEGAIAIGDYAAASEWIGAMDSTELTQPETLQVRLELARATGREELATLLEGEIHKARSRAK